MVGLDDGERLGERLGALRRETESHRRQGQRDQHPCREGRRQAGPAQDAIDDRPPEPALPVVPAVAADERNT